MDRLRARAIESLFLVQKMIGGLITDAGPTGIDFPTFPAQVGHNAGWVESLANATGATYVPKTIPTGRVSGFGATEAPRGALMHFITINGGKIERYQCVVPTTWNASPKDHNSTSGPMEQAMIGIPYNAVQTTKTTSNGTTITAGGGVEAMRVAQSFDPCIACAVH
jgi:Ni,Fe-hydrogenase I large subunit